MPNAVPLDVSGRPLRLRDVDIDAFLHPKTIAVIGASEQSAKPNTAMTRKFDQWSKQHGAAFYPVHPEYETVLGHACYKSIFEIPGDIDLAIILTGRAEQTFEEVLQRKAKFAVIFAAGFSETGAEGKKRERHLEQLVRSGDVRLLGPNTNLNAFEDFRRDLAGPSIALITQSGHQGRPVFQGQEIGIRLTHWAPTGNEVDLEFADFARHFADQPEVGVIACYIEGFKDGRTLMLAADHAAQLQKPIVMVKVGKTAAGQSMAQSHTGHLTGSDAVTSAVFRQFGVTRVDGLDELLEVSMALARTRPSKPPQWAKSGKAPGVCVYAISGGTGAHMADVLADAGLSIPDLTKDAQKQLHDGLIPAYLRVSNPVDCGGPPVADKRGRQILDVILADKNIDILVIPITGAVAMFSEPFTRDIIEVAQTSTKPIFVIWGAPAGTDDTYYKRLLDGGLPVFRTFNNCVKSVKAYVDYWSFTARYRSPFASAAAAPSPAAKKARKLLADVPPGEALSEWTSKQILRAYGIKTSKDVLCASAAEAAKAAKDIGFPVVMKISSPDLLHKTDVGVVKVGVSTPKEVRATYSELLTKAKKADRHARVDGVMVCEMVTGGVDTLIGVSTDELFGPVITFGLGGIFVEVFGDVSFRVPPFDEDEARRALAELKGMKVLQGTRGQKPADVDALIGTIMKVQQLAMDLADEVGELDINPLVVKPRGAVALDALVVKKMVVKR
ncbi:MAG TPA: acetate--CoA ligase family protein [Acidimicrobiia bacterium]|jgi:acyl-CoA synthetase (NDP forming)|nr:acetate--CoA ligase family protein [Acidimicrobiia bacterium]